MLELLPNEQSRLYKVSILSFAGDITFINVKRDSCSSETSGRKSSLTVRFSPVNSGISSASVAESSIRFFSPGSCVIISAISSWKPNSKDLSNSSMIKVSIVSGLKFPLDKWSVIRPGVPIMIAG